MAWMDNAGLYQKYGLEQTVPMAGGEYRTVAELREIEVKIDLTKLTSTATIITGGDDIFFPTGFMIEQIELVVETAATSGGAPTLDIGLMRTDRTTELDWDGLIAAEVLATLTPAGKKVVYNQGTSKAGALVGATTANIGQITARANTATFTAGVVTIRIKYRKA